RGPGGSAWVAARCRDPGADSRRTWPVSRELQGLSPGAWPGLALDQLTTLPPFFSHSALGTEMMPLPLHEFWPAQLLPAPAQEPWPLHSLMPTHFTLSAPALSSARALMAPVANSVAAAVAIKMPLLAPVLELSFSPGCAGVLFELPA